MSSEPPVRAEAERWVASWTAMPQLTEPENLPPARFTRDRQAFADTTLRQTIRNSAGGRRCRLRLSNGFGGVGLPIGAASVGLPAGGRVGVSAIQPGTRRPVTVSGRSSTTVPPGAQLVSDPLDLELPAGANLTVTLHLPRGVPADGVTGHPGSRTTSYLVAGDRVADVDLPGATAVDHWYFLSGLEVLTSAAGATVVLLGDSLTDGRGSTTNGNDRWPDQLLQRLLADPATASTVAVANQAAGGNRVLQHGLGPSALSRFDRDVLATSGVRWLIVFEGVNDLGTAEATPAAQRAVVDDLTTAYDQIVTRAHAAGLSVYGATLTPFGGSVDYDDPAGIRAAARQAVNAWIRGSGRFDAVLDFDRTVRDPATPGRLRPSYDEGDHLHINPAGYRALAEAVPTRLFAG